MRTQHPVWVTGAGGLIGSELVRWAAECVPGVQVIGLTRAELELTEAAAVRARFEREQPEVIIHCAAMSRSPDCEADPGRAWQVNVEVTRRLAGLGAGVRVVFFSTDLVFDGKKGGYVETDSVNPLSVYGETKAAAEQAVAGTASGLVVRTSLNGGRSLSGGRGFNEELRRAWAGGRSVRLFRDEYRSPVAAEVTARAVWDLVRIGATGVFHVAGGERLSRLEIGELIAARHPELDPRVESASIADYEGPARPPDTSLDCGKFERVSGVRLPGLREWLREHPESDF